MKENFVVRDICNVDLNVLDSLKNKCFVCVYNFIMIIQLLVGCNGIIVYRTRGHRDHMVVGFTTTCAISAYHH